MSSPSNPTPTNSLYQFCNSVQSIHDPKQIQNRISSRLTQSERKTIKIAVEALASGAASQALSQPDAAQKLTIIATKLTQATEPKHWGLGETLTRIFRMVFGGFISAQAVAKTLKSHRPDNQAISRYEALNRYSTYFRENSKTILQDRDILESMKTLAESGVNAVEADAKARFFELIKKSYLSLKALTAGQRATLTQTFDNSAPIESKLRVLNTTLTGWTTHSEARHSTSGRDYCEVFRDLLASVHTLLSDTVSQKDHAQQIQTVQLLLKASGEYITRNEKTELTRTLATLQTATDQIKNAAQETLKTCIGRITHRVMNDEIQCMGDRRTPEQTALDTAFLATLPQDQ